MENQYGLGDKVRLRTMNQIGKIPQKHIPAYMWRSTQQHELSDLLNYNREYYIQSIIFDSSTNKIWYNLHIPNSGNNLVVTDVMITKLLAPFHRGVFDILLHRINHRRIIQFEITENGKSRTASIQTKKLVPIIHIVNTSSTKLKPVMVIKFMYIDIITKQEYVHEFEYADLLNLVNINFTKASRQLHPEQYTINNFKLI